MGGSGSGFRHGSCRQNNHEFQRIRIRNTTFGKGETLFGCTVNTCWEDCWVSEWVRSNVSGPPPCTCTTRIESSKSILSLAVLWIRIRSRIRIRKDPNFFAGSESGSERSVQIRIRSRKDPNTNLFSKN